MIPDYYWWRVRDDEGIWHLVKWYTFKYHENESTNGTFCGKLLNNPAFKDLTPNYARGYDKPYQEDPEPRCKECPKELYKFMSSYHEAQAVYWKEKVK